MDSIKILNLFIKSIRTGSNVFANKSGLSSTFLNPKKPVDGSEDIETSYPDIKIVDDNTGRPVQVPVVTHNSNANFTRPNNYARCHGIWNLFPVDPFKLAFGNDFGQDADMSDDEEIDSIKAENRKLNRFDQALLFRTEYDRANSRIGPKEYGFDNSRSVPIVDRYAVENGQSELAFGLLANPMLFKNNLSYISVGMEMEDGVPDYVLSLNDVLMATYFGDRIMWSGRGDQFKSIYIIVIVLYVVLLREVQMFVVWHYLSGIFDIIFNPKRT